MTIGWIKAIGAVLALVSLVSAYWLFSDSTSLNVVFGGGELQATIERLGLWGPIAVVALMSTETSVPSG